MRLPPLWPTADQDARDGGWHPVRTVMWEIADRRDDAPGRLPPVPGDDREAVEVEDVDDEPEASPGADDSPAP